LKTAFIASGVASVLVGLLDRGSDRGGEGSAEAVAARGAPTLPPPLSNGQPERPRTQPLPQHWPRQEWDEAHNDPFTPGTLAPAVNAASVAATPAAVAAPAPVITAPVSPPVMGNPGIGTGPQPRVTWLGRMVAPDGARLTLLLNDGDGVVAQVGKPVGDAYVVKEVGEHSVRLERKAGGGELMVSAVP
jgi:hypothetical protein